MGGARGSNAVRHQQLLYEDDDEFVAGTWQFVQDGLAADAAVLVLLPVRRQRLLKSALGSQARRVQFSNMEAAGRNPNLIISVWRDFVDYHSRLGREVRGIGEPAYQGRRPAEYAEVVLHEALCNVAFSQGPAWTLLCPYSSGELPAEVLDSGRATHPELRNHTGVEPNDDYAGAEYAQTVMRAELPPPDAPEIPLPVADIRAIRERVAKISVSAGMPLSRVEELALATNEVAANAHRHGEPPPEASAWVSPTSVTVQIRDRGRLPTVLAGRFRPGLTDGSGRGLWMANQLCDLVQLRSTARGTVVRLVCWLHARPDRGGRESRG